MDFYLLLGVEREASDADIRRAYKRLARRFHPDINPGDQVAAQHYRQIAEAYETLIDPDRRKRYDTQGSLAARERADAVAFGFEGFDFSVRVSGEAAPTFGDLFADVFRQRAMEPAAGAERGSDLHVPLQLPFEQAIQGGTRQVNVTRLVACRTCRGRGTVRTTERRCPRCQGSGSLKSTRNHMVFSKPCDACGGRGLQVDVPCPSCHGRQLEMLVEPLTVHLAPGLQDGARVRMAGKGHEGRNGGDPGDLYISVHVEPHPRFIREGDDLRIVVPVAVHEAALGAKIDVPSLDGPVRLRVPPGTQSGQRFRLRERGAPSARDGRRGDLLVEVRLVLPPLLDERSKELLREFGRINNTDVRQELT
jgi:molecular chaperone DnaJ